MVGVAARALGALPVFALSTLPAMVAVLLGARLHLAFAVAALVGGLCGVAGYVLAFFFELPVGASQTAVAALLVVLAAGIRLLRGALA
jgi:zinc transport system permease protein